MVDPLLLASLLRTTSIAYESNLRQKNLEKDNIRLELDFLRSQISPHFLFNAINNVYSHAERRSEKIPEMILQLSDLLRYMLYETSEDFVSLTKDLQFIKQYVAIEQLRHDDHVKINLNIDEKALRTNYLIPPVLLIMFIENAFKHGIGQALSKAYVNIEIRLDTNHWLYFKVINSKPSMIAPHFFSLKKSGLGIANVRKRLSIMFTDKHHLEIHDELNTFAVTLTIQLNEQNF